MTNRFSSESGKVKGDEEEMWRPTLVTPLLVQVGSLAATYPTRPLVMGTKSTFYSLVSHFSESKN